MGDDQQQHRSLHSAKNVLCSQGFIQGEDTLGSPPASPAKKYDVIITFKPGIMAVGITMRWF